MTAEHPSSAAPRARIDVLFVYGTLLSGERRHGLVAGARQIRPASAPGRLYDTGRGYPALVEISLGDEGRVAGEALLFDDLAPLLPALDAYEGYDPRDPAGSLYLRVARSIRCDDGGELEAWVYAVPAERESALRAGGAVSIPSGAWRLAHRREDR